jgi:hypothetical protein
MWPSASGEKLFVDYCGATVPVVDAGQEKRARPAQIFGAVWGASDYTFAAAMSSHGGPGGPGGLDRLPAQSANPHADRPPHH